MQNEDVKNKEDLMQLDSLCHQIDVKWVGGEAVAGDTFELTCCRMTQFHTHTHTHIYDRRMFQDTVE